LWAGGKVRPLVIAAPCKLNLIVVLVFPSRPREAMCPPRPLPRGDLDRLQQHRRTLADQSSARRRRAVRIGYSFTRPTGPSFVSGVASCRPSASEASCSQYSAKLSHAVRSPTEGAVSAFSTHICAYRRYSAASDMRAHHWLRKHDQLFNKTITARRFGFTHWAP